MASQDAPEGPPTTDTTPWGYERATGGTVADWDGFFAGTISTEYLEPGFYTVVVSDTAGAVRYSVVEVVY